MGRIHLDFETRSEVDIYECGAWAYSCHPSTEILCFAFAIGDGPVLGARRQDILNRRFPPQVFDPERLYYAHNAFFEQCIWENIGVKKLGWPRTPIKRWRCTAAKAAARALPRSLEGVGAALELPIKKDLEGKAFMLKLGSPNRNLSKKAGRTVWNEDPQDFERLFQYCCTDVLTEREVDRVLPDLTPKEQTIWLHDQVINRRGVCIDVPAVHKALDFISVYSENMLKGVEEVTNGALDSVTKRQKVLDWCGSHGVELENYSKASVASALSGDLPEIVRQVLETRQQLGKSSTAKYLAMSNSVGEDSRIRDLLIYHGAATGRWAGKLIQVHNLPKGQIKDTDLIVRDLMRYDLKTFEMFYPALMEALSDCIRGMIIAPPGKELLVADYNAIEARVLNWLAGEERIIEMFRKGEPIYENMASIVYDRKITKEDTMERQLGKTAELGCGYGMGAPKFRGTCASWKIFISDELAEKTVKAYRSTHPMVVRMWYDIERCAINTVETGERTVCGKVAWHMDNGVLLCRLPSGRDLAFNGARIEKVKAPWGELKDALTFMGLKKIKGQTTVKWIRKSTYGGELVENITQGVARDLLAEALLRTERAGFAIDFHVHDEAVAEVNKGDSGTLADFCRLLEEVPGWASGCPIKVAGWKGTRYKKA